jgi:hypothetical protein
MGKSSRQKRRTYQTPKRARTSANLVWYAAAAVLVIAGSLAVAMSRSNSASGVGPVVGDHWHVALGVNNCGKWTPNWLTTFSGGNPSGPVRAGTSIYAGLHSHGDGLIHMEPQTSADEGKHATVGTYFEFAGFKVNATSLEFGTLDPVTTVKVKNGDKCNGKPGVLRWSVDGKEKTGNPADYKLLNGDVVILAFTTADAKLPPKTEVPSYAALQDFLGNPDKPENPPGVTVPANTTPSTVPGATTTTAAGSSTTATTAAATTTSPPGATDTTTP